MKFLLSFLTALVLATVPCTGTATKVSFQPPGTQSIKTIRLVFKKGDKISDVKERIKEEFKKYFGLDVDAPNMPLCWGSTEKLTGSLPNSINQYFLVNRREELRFRFFVFLGKYRSLKMERGIAETFKNTGPAYGTLCVGKPLHEISGNSRKTPPYIFSCIFRILQLKFWILGHFAIFSIFDNNGEFLREFPLMFPKRPANATPNKNVIRKRISIQVEVCDL